MIRGKRILILQAPIERSVFRNDLSHFPPMGPGHLAGYLRSCGHEVDMLDVSARLSSDLDWAARFDDLARFYEPADVLDELERKSPGELGELVAESISSVRPGDYDLVCVSAGADYSIFQINFAFLLAAHVQRDHGVLAVLGGNNIRFTWIFRDVFEPLLRAALPAIWVVAHGPGEAICSRAIEILDLPAPQRRAIGIPGRIHVANGILTSEDKGQATIIEPDFDGLRMSDYEHLMSATDAPIPILNTSIANDELVYRFPLAFGGALSKYLGVTHRETPERLRPTTIVPLVFNFNCPYNCTFCTESDPDAGKVVLGKARAVVDSIKRLKEKHGTRYFMFFNNYINLSKRFARDFATMLIEEDVDIRWSDCARFNGLDEEMLTLLWRSGCRKLTFGFETGNQKISEYIDKQIDFSQGQDVLRMCREIGIYADLEVIAGLPFERETEFDDTCSFVARNRENINHFAPNTFFVAPDSLFGLFPERYDIEIVGRESYADACARNKAWFLRGMNWYEKPINFRMWHFREIGGRNADELEAFRLRVAEKMQKIWADLTLGALDQFIPSHRLIAYTHGVVSPKRRGPAHAGAVGTTPV